MSNDESGQGLAPRPSLVRRGYEVVKFPPPAEGQLFSTRASGASYLGAWGLTATHLTIWILIAVSIVTSKAVTIGNSVLSFVTTCLLIWVVISIHHRFQIERGGKARHLVSVWWRGPWDPVGRQIWLPVRFGSAWRVVRHGPQPDPR
ncbi:MAG TPA: hypothetical protein VNG12_24160 [Acidimicrobiales bacterium]|nr:hypothetical protein [Acidimicrobiales bacterium]